RILMPESGKADMNFLRIFLAWWRGTWLVALRSQADTLFYATEPCITGMTPSVRGRFAHRWPNPKSTTARARRAVLASNRYRPARLPAGAGLGAAGPPFQEFAIQGIAVLRGKCRCSNRSRRRRSAGCRRHGRACGQRHVAVEPFLRRLEAGPARHR